MEKTTPDRRKLLIFDNGYRTVVKVNTYLKPPGAKIVEVIPLIEATEDEFEKIRKTPNDDKLIDKVIKRNPNHKRGRG